MYFLISEQAQDTRLDGPSRKSSWPDADMINGSENEEVYIVFKGIVV